MKQLLAVIGGVLFFMMLTGAFLPSLISTDQLPMMVILLVLASVAFTIGAIVLIVIRRINKSEDKV